MDFWRTWYRYLRNRKLLRLRKRHGGHDTPPPKPLLRGWLHLVMTPLALFMGIALIVLAPTITGRIGGAVWLVAAIVLFGTSATYHRGTWKPRSRAMLRQADHANIFVFIAASYTPLALGLLPSASRTTLLWLIWIVAAVGVAFELLWWTAPRWIDVILYLAMGWVALGWVNEFWTSAGPLVFGLISLGGVVYTIGAGFYALKRPNPWPRHFGHHEMFHACTIIAAICHYIAIMIATLR